VIEGDEAEALLRRRAADPSVRDRLVVGFRPLAVSLAHRFVGRGEPLDDLIQVASLGLIKAVDRYDTGHEGTFLSFASATIVGELKHHLRDRAWSLHLPRSLQERVLRVGRIRSELTVGLGRSPSMSEIAASAGIDVEEVVEALSAAHAYQSDSIDAPVGEEDGGISVADRLGVEDEAAAVAESLAVIAPAVRSLPARQRRILFLRFYRDLTQTEIAGELGISQMHVSRLLAQALAAVRAAVGGPLA
jgi:RNA polymerase sigma-B factor